MSTYVTERLDARGVNLSGRFAQSAAVVASPQDNAETTICTLTIPADVQVFSGIEVVGFAAYTVGTSGVSVDLKLRQTDTSGTTLAATGATTATAADLGSLYLAGFDTASAAGQVYVLTMTVASGAAESTVSAVYLRALVV